MQVIYEPRGKAREYAELAINLFTGCAHKCKYCYCPAIMRKTLDQWSNKPYPRINILKKLESDCKKATDEIKNKELLFSFMCDCYQGEESALLTREALLIVEKYGFKKVNVLTKAGFRAASDFDIFQRNKGWKFGSTIIFNNEALRHEWEQGAPSIVSRYEAVKLAHKLDIFTWVSIEPVIVPQESLIVMQNLKLYVDLWKVGKLNHFKEIESKINWHKFYQDAKNELSGCNVYWKKDLLRYK